MKFFSRFLFFCSLLVLITANLSFAQPSGVSLDEVAHLRGGAVAVDIPTTFKIRFNNDYGANVHGFSFAFRYYISNNGEMSPVVFEPVAYTIINTNNWTSYFDFQPVAINEYSIDGLDSDSVGIKGIVNFFALPEAGLPDGFSEVVLELQTAVLSGNIGDTLCIDSAFSPPTGTWHWHTAGNVRYEDVPWSGPHCFEIVEKCCVGIRGNINTSSDESIDISDLVTLVDFMFLEGTPPYCSEEANFNGVAGVDIADLVDLVAYMFQSGAEPAPCL